MKHRKSIAILVALALTTNAMWATAGSVVPDTRNGQGPIIDQAANGVPVVQIKNPNDKGLSHNQYLDFNVDNKGLILNNANKNVSTELAGFIAANPTMGAYPAKQILNEVTSTSRTAIGGAIEVAGNKADVIIANPNGIQVNNGTFINTGNVTLTTGTPVISNGSLEAYNIQGGTISVESQGLNASQTPHTDILAKSIEVNAGIWANDLRMVTGKNTVQADTLDIQQKQDTTDVGLDVAALGGMYANTIFLKGTSKGLGVNNNGQIVGKSNIKLDASGKITNIGTIQSDAITVNTASDINQAGHIEGTNTQVASAGNVINTGTMAGSNTLRIDADTLANQNNGKIYGDNIQLQTNTLSQTATDETKPSIIVATDSVAIGANTIENKNKSIIKSGTTMAIGKTVNKNGEVSGSVSVLTNDGSTIDIGTNGTISADIINNKNAGYTTKQIVVRDHEFIDEVAGSGQPDRHTLTDTRKHGNHEYGPDEVVIFDDESDHLAVYGTTYEEWSRYKYNRVTKQDVIDTTNPGSITAGGNLDITANHVVNDVSRISSAGTLTGNIINLENINPPGNIVYEDTGTSTSYWRHHRDGRDSTGSRDSEYTNTTVIPTPVPASVYASNDATGVSTNVDAYNPMAVVTTEPTANYYLETDPAFTNKHNFLSSDYFVQQLKSSPDYVQKRLGDGYYEQNLVMQDILKQTGKNRIDAGLTAEEQYRKLMDAGVQASIDTGWVLGRALTAAEQASLEKDIVWLVEKTVVLPDGRTVQALVPTVYLAPTTKRNSNANVQGDSVNLQIANLNNSGSIVATKSLTIKGDSVTNQGGLLQGKEVALHSNQDITNTGTIAGDKSVQLEAKRDIVNTGGQILQNDENGTLSLTAGRDIAISGKTVDNKVDVVWDSRNQRHETTTSVIQGVVQGKGNVNLQAGQDITVKGSTVASGNNLDVTAGRNVMVTTMASGATVKEDHYHVGKTGGGNKQVNETHELTTVTQQVGSSLMGKNVSIKANNKNTVQGSEVLASDTVRLEGSTISLDKATSTSHAVKEEHVRKSGTFSKEKTDGISITDTKTVTGSTISGKTVAIISQGDVSGTSVTALGQDKVNITASGNVTIGADKNTSDVSSKYRTKKSGFLGGSGFGFSIGTEKLNTADTSHEENTVMSTIASSQGDVSITANKDIHMTSTNIGGQKSVSITGANVTLDGNADNIHQTHDVEYKKTALTVSVGGVVPDMITNTKNLINSAQSRDDKRLAAFELNEARRQLQDGLKDIKSNFGQTFTTEPDKQGRTHTEKGNDRLVNLNISIGSSKASSHDVLDQNVYKGSSLVSVGDVTVTSTDTKGTGISMTGEWVQGNTVTLNSASNINLDAGKNEMHAISDSKSSGWNIGATVGLQGSGFMGLTAGANASKGNTLTDRVAYTGTHVTANDTVTLQAKNDTAITGSQVSSDRVIVNTGGNLSITSLQEQDNYKERTKSGGFSISTGYSPLSKPNTFADVNRGKIDSTYKSVTEQAGLYAGNQGYDVTVGKETKLTGAVIASEGKANKNTLNTGSLTMKDVTNEAHYSYSNQGLQYRDYANPKDETGKYSNRVYNQMGLTPNLSPGAKGDATSVTKSAISDGHITVNGKLIDSKTINTDTHNTVHKLSKIFDKKKIEERQALAKYFAQNAYEAVHRLGEQYGNPQDPNNPWRDGGANKVLLHSVIAEITAQLAGNAPGSGAVAGGVNEATINKIIDSVGRDHPDQAQMLSAILGGVVNKALGKPTDAGMAVGQYGTKWNGLSTYQQDEDYYESAHWYLIKNLDEGKEAGVVYVLMSALTISLENPEIPEAAENDMIYTLNRTAKFLHLRHRYDKDLGMTNNLRAMLAEYYAIMPHRNFITAKAGIGLGIGGGANIGPVGANLGAKSVATVSTDQNALHWENSASATVSAGSYKVGYVAESDTNLNQYETDRIADNYSNNLNNFNDATTGHSGFVFGRNVNKVDIQPYNSYEGDYTLHAGGSFYFIGGGEVEGAVNFTVLLENLNVVEESSETKVNKEVEKLKEEGKI